MSKTPTPKQTFEKCDECDNGRVWITWYSGPFKIGPVETNCLKCDRGRKYERDNAKEKK